MRLMIHDVPTTAMAWWRFLPLRSAICLRLKPRRHRRMRSRPLLPRGETGDRSSRLVGRFGSP